MGCRDVSQRHGLPNTDFPARQMRQAMLSVPADFQATEWQRLGSIDWHGSYLCLHAALTPPPVERRGVAAAEHKQLDSHMLARPRHPCPCTAHAGHGSSGRWQAHGLHHLGPAVLSQGVQGLQLGFRRAWLLQCTAPYMDVMGVKSMICTSPRKWLSRTIWRAVCACTLMMRLLPRLSTLQPYSCARAPQRGVRRRSRALGGVAAGPMCHAGSAARLE